MSLLSFSPRTRQNSGVCHHSHLLAWVFSLWTLILCLHSSTLPIFRFWTLVLCLPCKPFTHRTLSSAPLTSFEGWCQLSAPANWKNTLRKRKPFLLSDSFGVSVSGLLPLLLLISGKEHNTIMVCGRSSCLPQGSQGVMRGMRVRATVT